MSEEKLAANERANPVPDDLWGKKRSVLDELERKAKEATKGPWSIHVSDDSDDFDGPSAWTILDGDGAWLAHLGPAPEDAAFIAAASPDVVLKLIAVARAAEQFYKGEETLGAIVVALSALTGAKP